MTERTRSLLALLTTGAIAACASQGAIDNSNSSPENVFPPRFERSVRPFSVTDDDGNIYEHPTLGGFNVPRPQLIDIDNDGDVDLFVQEQTGRIMFFEHTDASSEPQFAWRTDHYQDLEVGEWYRFADMDADGDLDLLSEEPFSYIRYYRNEGSAEQPSFVLAADTLRDTSGDPIFSDRQNIPNITDIDCDGRLDLFLGRLEGTVTRYEEQGTDASGVPRFQFVTDRFENIEIVAQIGSMHGANTMAFEDIDGDGDQDLFWGDFFEAGLLFIENRGSCAAPLLRSEPTAFPPDDPVETSGYNAPTFGDVDQDGDLDLIVGVLGGAYNPNLTSADNLHYYEQTAPGRFRKQTERLITGIDIGNESIPVPVDLDADGDLDIVLANKIDPGNMRTSRVYRFENTGTPSAPVFRQTGLIDFGDAFHHAPAFGDLDADGDLDVLLGSWQDDVAFLQNQGTATTPAFVLVDSSLVSLTRGSNSTPALGDVDADGDLDLFVGEASGTINFYLNSGTASAPDFSLISDNFNDIDIGRRSFPTLVDLDRDGDLDLIVGADTGALLFFRNTGTPQAPEFVADTSFSFITDGYATPAFADLDADGDLDMLSGGIGGGLLFYENRGVSR